MTFDRQLDIFVAIVSAVIVFAGLTWFFGVPPNVSLLIAIVVLVLGLLFGRVAAAVIRGALGF
jgi:hypothetical protein